MWAKGRKGRPFVQLYNGILFLVLHASLKKKLSGNNLGSKLTGVPISFADHAF